MLNGYCQNIMLSTTYLSLSLGVGDTLALVLGDDDLWYELSRSINN